MSKIIYPFAAIPNQVLRSGHGAINVAVLAVLMSHGRSTASAKTLANEIGCDRKSVFSAINYWKDNGPRYGILLTTKGKEDGRSGLPTVIEIEITTCTENGTGMTEGCTENGTGGVPKTERLPVPKTVHKEEPIKKNQEEDTNPPTPQRGDAAKPQNETALVKPIPQALDMLGESRKDLQIIGLFAKAKKITFENRESVNSFVRRNLRGAKALVGYDPKRIANTMHWLINNADFKWTLESVAKYIDEDLTKVRGQTAQCLNLDAI